MTRVIGVLVLGVSMLWQPPAEGSFGRGPVPRVVGMAGLKAVTIKVSPSIMIARRSDVRVEVRVPHDEANRLLSITWSSDTGSVGSSWRPLDGEDAPVLHTLTLPSQPLGRYTFIASLFDRTWKLRARDEARIITPEVEGTK
jgi:hypothetical protein